MSGIYIKGMEMPTNCFLCPLSVLNGERLFCEVTKDEVLRAKRSSDCPLILVPDHGRMIDADALLSQYKGNFLTAQTDYAEGLRDIAKDIANAPTIIPAEEEGEA